MAPLTAGRNTPQMAENGTLLDFPVAAGVTIYDGSLVVLDADGNAKPATKATNLKTVGRAETFVDNSKGIAGELSVLVRRGVFFFDNSSGAGEVKATHVLTPCYIADDQTVTATATSSSVAGLVLAVNEGGVAVEICPALNYPTPSAG